MKNKNKVVLIILFFSILIMTFSYEEQKSKWSGRIEKVNGIKIIMNPNEPLYGETIFDLEEDLVIGNEENENYMFCGIIDLDVDRKENIFILDIDNCRIQKFDRDGNFLQTIGKKGEGLAEFKRPWNIYLNSEDEIYVGEHREIHIFSAKGEFIKTIKLSEDISLFGGTEETNFFARTSSSTSEGPTNDIALFSSKGQRIRTVASFPSEKSVAIPVIEPSFSYYYTPRLCFCSLNDNLGVYGYPSEYRLFTFNSSGNFVSVIEKDETVEPFTDKEKGHQIDFIMKTIGMLSPASKVSRGEVEKAFEFPKHKPFYEWILNDDRGRFYVFKYNLPFFEEQTAVCDLFSKEGYYLYKVKMLKYPRLIKDGHAYKSYIYKSSRHQNKEFTRIKRYKIKNWMQIKEGI